MDVVVFRTVLWGCSVFWKGDFVSMCRGQFVDIFNTPVRDVF